MKITWLGHSTFKIESEKTIVTDPHPPQFGVMPADLIADIVTVSHSHPDHSYTAGVGGKPEVVNTFGDDEFGELKIKGVQTYHDDAQGQIRGDNIVFVFETEGSRLVHLGDLGHVLTEDQLEEIGIAPINVIDILMIPVGGVYTIDATQAVEVVRQLQPKIILPMHYKTPNMPTDLPIAIVDEFIKKLDWGVSKVSELEIDQNSISHRSGSVFIFE